MKILVTGSSGHLGEALVRKLRALNHDVVSIDIKASPYTTHVGSITNPELVAECMHDVHTVYHTATLHKPHVATHATHDFVSTNITGTLTLLEAAVRAKVSAFVFTSTTSTFGDALRPDENSPAAWITEAVLPIPRNIYGVTKVAAEDLCHLFHRKQGLNCIVLRTSRFFPEEDDDKARRSAFSDDNLKVNELLYRRVDLEDVVAGHLCASEHAETIGFGRYILSATTPFKPEHAKRLRTQLPEVLKQLNPDTVSFFAEKDWEMLSGIDRVYVNDAARKDLNWQPIYDFNYALNCLQKGQPYNSQLARDVVSKGYHEQVFEDGPFPV